MEKKVFGLCIKDVRRLAYQLPIRNNIPNKFNKDCGMARKDWMGG